ncbi:DUF1014-domain-containing protein [Ascodesmis nigricans]|uniref:DUF1014-domain-containing protein n=1 Tax=Ascodesmis nigricans TaxID=341454 RepID=A0A4S2MM33_9PEZI|nr:DUF1014-domain-containing protein [Ascodesmis nigricans]
MGKPKTENSKKAAGQARKAEAANAKAAAEQAKKDAAESATWQDGAKSNAKKEAAEAKKREAAARKAEADRLLAEEEASAPSKPKGGKTATKRGGIDGALSAISASGIDDALDALTLANDKSSGVVIDRHPERRFKAAYAAYKDKRLPEVKEEYKGLRLNQMIEVIKKEFDKHPDNPFNQTGVVGYNASKEEVEEARKKEKEKIEKRLAGK